MKLSDLLKKPTAWFPLALSFMALAFIFGYVAAFGIVRNQDEGAPARIFQLLIFAQAVLITFFAARWLAREPKRAIVVLAMQIIALIVPIVVILLFES